MTGGAGLAAGYAAFDLPFSALGTKPMYAQWLHLQTGSAYALGAASDGLAVLIR